MTRLVRNIIFLTLLATIYCLININTFNSILNSKSSIKREIVLDSVRFDVHGATRSNYSKYGYSNEMPNRTIILNDDFRYIDTLQPVSIWCLDNVSRLKQCRNEDAYPLSKYYLNLVGTFLLFFSPFFVLGVYGIYKSLKDDE